MAFESAFAQAFLYLAAALVAIETRKNSDGDSKLATQMEAKRPTMMAAQ